MSGYGEILVDRLISYQKGETEFELTVLITTFQSFDLPGKNGSAPVVVRIIDIDDNDPVFDNMVYIFHVEEENASEIGQKQPTSPPVFAFDQDTGINDKVTYSINEHSAFGSFVVRVLAIDADEGDNALFNYTLKTEESLFAIQTDILGNLQYGIVTVSNSSALDREIFSYLNMTVQTKEFRPPQGGDCISGMCSITITIQLIDINDNSPVFDNSSYKLIVKDNNKDVFLMLVNASDADEGENADLRYSCVPSYALGSDGCSVITVEDKTGEISLSQPLDSLQVYYASIEACDSPTDVSQMRCTTVPIRISLNPDLLLNVTSYNFTVYENLPAGTYVADILNYNLQFELQDKEFELNERTLRTKRSFDREEQAKFLFVISTHNEKSTNISVLVTVLDVNDNSPSFGNSSYILTVMDNRKNIIVGMINASDADEGENAVLTYSCVSSVTSNDACDVMTVNDTTGEVVLLGPLDSLHTYYALVEACDSPTDFSQSRCTTVPVTISLHPDLALNVTSYNFTVHENLPAGTYVGDILTYNDYYSLQHDDFELLERTLRTTKSLDRERQPHYMLVISTNNKNNTNITVLVIVLDVNDNSPVFNKTNYKLTVTDNTNNSTVDTIDANDDDEGEYADLRYSCVSSIHTANDGCRQITINNTTGEIMLQKPLPNPEIYFALVEACDSPTEVSQSRCTTVPFNISLPPDFHLNVTSYNLTVYENLPAGTYVGDLWNNTNISVLVTVLDVNDNSPVFNNTNYNLTVVNNTKDALIQTHVTRQLTPHNGEWNRCTTVPIRISLPPDYHLNVTSYNFTVHENLPAGTYVGDILNNDHNFELQDDTFELHERTLRTKQPLDREKQDHYLFVINTNNQNNTNITVQVSVLDVNDNSPVFNNTNYKLTVVNNTKDALVETVRARDADESENADLSYKCVSVADVDGCGEITVNNETGDIRLRQRLTKSQMYFALVEACDNPVDASQSRCTSVPIRTSLPPNFDLNVTSYNFTVHENLPAGTYVGDLLDYDNHFELHHDKFQLDERTIRTKDSLDREAQDHYMFVINTNNQNNTNISVLVTVLDVNDNSPVFDNSNYRLTVVNNTKDALVHKIDASDADEGENAHLRYRCMPSYVSSSNDCSVFTVNNTTGEIRLQQPLPRSEMYFVLVEACDTPTDISQSRCTTVPVRISWPSDFDLNVTSYNFTVHENLPAGTYVGDILSYDPHFELRDDTFELKERNLQTVEPLDREKQDQYMFVINTNDQNNTNISVLVTVLDVNDNSPVFNKSNYRLLVKDNETNTFGETINASDADEGENAVLTYSCVSSVTSNDACEVITVNDTTGEIRLSWHLVGSHTYYALVEACDSPTDISQRRCTTVPVSLHLPSALSVTSYNFTVHENLPAGTYVGEILNYNDFFVLQHDNFELHEGTLRTKNPLDREDQDHHNLIVNTNNQNNTNISVLVIVLDVNDNNPVFNPNNGSVTLSGKETTGHAITAVNASDLDEGDNAKITYILQPDSMLQYFYINDSGAVILQTLSTLETMDLLIKASDGGSPSLSGFYTLRITIPAVNGSVVIFAPVTSDKLEKTRIESELMRILGVNVTVETVRQHSVDSSAIYITARGMSTGQPLKVEELQKLVDSKPAEIADLFRQSIPDGTNERAIAADDFTTPVIVLIVIAAVLLIALIIATVFIARAHKSSKRNKRMFKSLSTPATFYDTSNTDAEKSDESIGTINPAFVEDDESQSVTLVNETEVTSVADMQSFHEAGDNDDDVSENEGTGRPPDADSGVPSDRENGHGDDDDIDNSSDDGSSSPQSPRSSRYLEAVLDEPLLNSSDPGHDVVDVTSPEMYSDALEALLLPVDSLESGPPAEPPVDFDVQESYPTFVEEEFPKEVTEAALPIVQAEAGSNLDPVTPDDEVEDTGSLNGFLGFRIPTRSFTPPMVRKSQEQREEELEPMPEEPMPDYGKRVRFNFQVTEHEITDYNDNDGDLDEDGNDTENVTGNEEEFPTPPPPPPPALSTDDNFINESSDDSRGGDEHDPNTNKDEEITSF
ncbi:hypothetical protein C0Q70_10928 [Pomacea canaliculata]|uniref:Cadherin domain-containing protein n=1 Tax=Pomacea canaliculata TaxID=400727 RepID=A0A2T7P4K1_POMCA|nr:hypothetical protein C0Q70_10928 [Pomacea canaliculata]